MNRSFPLLLALAIACDPTGRSIQAVDLLQDSSGTGNCWAGNTFVSSGPESLPACE